MSFRNQTNENNLNIKSNLFKKNYTNPIKQHTLKGGVTKKGDFTTEMKDILNLAGGAAKTQKIQLAKLTSTYETLHNEIVSLTARRTQHDPSRDGAGDSCPTKPLTDTEIASELKTSTDIFLDAILPQLSTTTTSDVNEDDNDLATRTLAMESTFDNQRDSLTTILANIFDDAYASGIADSLVEELKIWLANDADTVAAATDFEKVKGLSITANITTLRRELSANDTSLICNLISDTNDKATEALASVKAPLVNELAAQKKLVISHKAGHATIEATAASRLAALLTEQATVDSLNTQLTKATTLRNTEAVQRQLDHATSNLVELSEAATEAKAVAATSENLLSKSINHEEAIASLQGSVDKHITVPQDTPIDLKAKTDLDRELKLAKHAIDRAKKEEHKAKKAHADTAAM